MNPGPNYLMLSPIQTGEKSTSSGIVYQLENKDDDLATKKGKVVKMGERVNSHMISGNKIQIGDQVNFFKHHSNKVNYCGDKIFIVHINSVSSID